jgi:hypothetical protein
MALMQCPGADWLSGVPPTSLDPFAPRGSLNVGCHWLQREIAHF